MIAGFNKATSQASARAFRRKQKKKREEKQKRTPVLRRPKFGPDDFSSSDDEAAPSNAPQSLTPVETSHLKLGIPTPPLTAEKDEQHAPSQTDAESSSIENPHSEATSPDGEQNVQGLSRSTGECRVSP